MRSLFSFMLVLPSLLMAQNLVPNPGFLNLTDNFPTGFSTAFDKKPINDELRESFTIAPYNIEMESRWEFLAQDISSCELDGTGYMLLCNGPGKASEITKDVIRTGSITIEKSTCYRFGIWVKGRNAKIKLAIKLPSGSYAGRQTVAVPIGHTAWQFVSGTFMSEANQTSVILAVRDSLAQAAGNDFALDEISLTTFNKYNTYSTCNCPNSFRLGNYGKDGTNGITEREDPGKNIIQTKGEWAVQVYPNPASDAIHYSLNAGAEGPYSVTLYDQIGRSIYQSAGYFGPGSEMGTVQRDGEWGAGLYFLHFTSTDTGRTFTKTIVLE